MKDQLIIHHCFFIHHSAFIISFKEGPMISKLLVAYDGSKQSDKAFNLALDLATKLGVKMVVLSVARPPEPPVAFELQAVLDSATEYYEAHFKRMKEDADKLGG